MPYSHHKFPLGNTVPDLRGLSFAAAFGMAFNLSGKSEDEVSSAMRWSRATANRIFHNQDYRPSLPTVPKLSSILGNTIIARWIIDNADFLVEHAKPTDVPTLFRQLREMMQAVAGLLEEGEKAMQDGKIVPIEARRILRELADLFRVGGSMVVGLQSVIEEGRE